MSLRDRSHLHRRCAAHGYDHGEEILTLHPDVHIYDEVHFSERVVDRLGAHDELSPKHLRTAAAILIKETAWAGASDDAEASIARLVTAAGPPPVSYASLFEAYLSTEAGEHGKTVWGDSSPQDVLYMDQLKSWYPDASSSP